MSEFEEELKAHYKKLEAEGLYDRKSMRIRVSFTPSILKTG